MLTSLRIVLIVFVFTCGLSPASAFAQDRSFTLTILHTNDTQSRIDQFTEAGSRCTAADAAENRCFGGVARRSTIIKQVRAEGGNSLLLDAGNQFQGTLFYDRYKGEDAYTFMNLLGYQVMTVGNHEFDDGPQNLARFIGHLDFPVLGANIDAGQEPSLAGLIQPYTILEVNGTKIGVVGFTTEDTSILSSPGPNVRFLNIERTVQAAVDELTAQGVTIIVAISQASFDRDQEVAKNVTGIDIIIGGHTQTYLSNTDPIAAGPYPTTIKSPDASPVLIVSAYRWGKYLGRLDVTFDPQGKPETWSGEPILLDASVPMDPEVQTTVTEFSKPLDEFQKTILGHTTTLLDGDRGSCRFHECTMGNLVADAIRWATASEGVQMVILNAGSFRSNIAEGDITMGNILEVLPFSNTIATLEIKGADMITALENGVSRTHSSQNEGTGRFPQVSGLRYTWTSDKLPGERIISVEVQNPDGSFSPIDPNATYKIATSDYIRQGGDGYSVFMDKAIQPYDAGSNLENAVGQYIVAHTPIHPQLDGRILEAHTQTNPFFSAGVLIAALLSALAGIGLLIKQENTK